MFTLQSQRRFLDAPKRFITKNSVYGYEEEKQIHKSTSVQIYDSSKYIHIPIYLYGSITQLVKVDLQKQAVLAKFTLYATLLVDLTHEHVQQLKADQLARHPQSAREVFLVEKLGKLREFITNNVIIECGDKVIDVINQERGQSEEQVSEDSDSSDDQEPDDYVCKKVKSHSSKSNAVTYQIQSLVSFDLTLNNIFFPYLTIDCSLRVRARSQYYQDITIKYKMLSFCQEEHSIRQFSCQFFLPRHQKFGIYRVNTTIDSFIVKPVERQMVGFGEQQIYSLTRYLQFRYEIYTFNVPFILRNLVPQLVLCFVSLMCYLAGAEAIWDVYGNVILLMITLIQLLSNFSSSKFYTSNFNLFQANLFGIIVINILLTIIGTINFYNSDVSIPNLNSKNALFWVSVAIGVFFVVSNVAILAYFGCKVKGYISATTARQRHITNLWLWNEELFENFIDDVDGTLRQTL